MQSFPILFDLGLVVTAAALLLLAGRTLGVPPLLSYMVAGLLLGPGAGLLSASESIALFSELGIALLLFLVGLELSLARLRDVGGSALSAGLLQVALTTLLGAGLALLLGIPRGDALLLGLALAFSSTVVVVKLLDRTGDVSSLHGRLAVGILLVQDVVVAVVLTLLSGLAGEGGGMGAVLAGLGRAGAGIVTLGLAAWAGARWLLPRGLGWLASSGEALFVTSLTWCFAFILAAEAFHVSIELGAFIAGVAVAQCPYAGELERRVHSLADFFLAVFFVTLGASMDPAAALERWPTVLALCAFVLVLKPALVTALLARRRGGPRTAFLTGLTLGQVSEFAFILMALAAGAGLVESEDLGALLGAVGLVTIGASAVLVPLGPALYRRLGRLIPGRGPDRPGPVSEPLIGHVVVVGMNTLGRLLVERFAERGGTVVAVDTDPGKLAGLPALTVFGNVDSPAVLGEAGIPTARLVVCALHIEDVNALLAFRCRRLGVPVSVHAFDPALAEELIEIGADHLMVSKVDGIGLMEAELRRVGVLG